MVRARPGRLGDREHAAALDRSFILWHERPGGGAHRAGARGPGRRRHAAVPAETLRKNRPDLLREIEVAKEYLSHLKALVAAIRRDTGVDDLPFLYGTPRRTEDPDDISDLVPSRAPGPYPAVEWVLKAHWDAQTEVAAARIVVMRDIETHPKNVHYNTAGQLELGKLFAEAFLDK